MSSESLFKDGLQDMETGKSKVVLILINNRKLINHRAELELPQFRGGANSMLINLFKTINGDRSL